MSRVAGPLLLGRGALPPIVERSATLLPAALLAAAATAAVRALL